MDPQLGVGSGVSAASLLESLPLQTRDVGHLSGCPRGLIGKWLSGV